MKREVTATVVALAQIAFISPFSYCNNSTVKFDGKVGNFYVKIIPIILNRIIFLFEKSFLYCKGWWLFL